MTVNKKAITTQLAHKIHIPKIPGNIVHRQRLVDLLHRNLDAGIQTICAPAGYGKTTLLIDFCNDLDIPVCWYSIDNSDRDVSKFIDGIVESIRLKFTKFGRTTKLLLEVTEKGPNYLTQLAGALPRDISRGIPDYFLLVMEDYHSVDGSEVDELLNNFVKQMPENCHILISSRTGVNIPSISTRFVHGQAFTLTSQDLAFSVSELKELLENQKGPMFSDAELEKLVCESEGWIVGMLLHFERMRSGETLFRLPSLSREDIFSYLASEVYEHLPASIQSFLIKSSVLDQIDPEICDSMLGMKVSRKNLREIQRRNLFLSSVTAERLCYRYHPLFREFLSDKLASENFKEFCRLHMKAATIFKAECRWQEAIDHFVSAQQYSRAKNIIKQIGQEMINKGKWTSVAKWIDVLPRRYRIADDDLLLLRAQCDIHTGQIDEATKSLTKIIDAEPTLDTWLRKAKALSWRSAAYRLAGNLAASLIDAKASIAFLDKNKGPADSLGEAYRRLGSIYLEKDNMPTSLKYLKRALNQFSSIFAIEQIAAVHNALGVAYQRLGKLTESVMHLNLARQGWQRVGDHGSLAMVLNNLGLMYQCQGDFESALKTFHLGLHHARESGYRRMETCITISTADLLRDACLFHEALLLYEEGLKEAEEIIEVYYMVCALAGTGETQRLLGEVDKAELFLKQAISLAEEHSRHFEATLTSVRLGIIEYERGEYEKALLIFKKAATYFRKVGDKEALARTCFHTAQTMFLSKRFNETKVLLLEASHLAEELGYDSFFVIEGRNSILLLQYATLEGIGVNRFGHVLDKVKSIENGSRLLTPSSGIRVDTINTHKPNIEAFSFGEAKILINARVITPSDWRSSRATEMFYFLLSSKTTKTREQIATMLWPDLSPSKSTSNFHITLYRVRHALFPGIVTVQDGRYGITPGLGIWFDAAEFLGIIDRAIDTSSNLESEVKLLQKAIDIYRGPFLIETYSEWAENLRHELESKYLKALTILFRWYSETEDYRQALDLLEKIAAIDPYNEELFSEIETWNCSNKAMLSSIREFRRYIDWLKDEYEAEYNTDRPLSIVSGRQYSYHNK